EVIPSKPGNIPQFEGFSCLASNASHPPTKNAVAACEDQPPRQRFSSTQYISHVAAVHIGNFTQKNMPYRPTDLTSLLAKKQRHTRQSCINAY
ncbi:MAG: hypothetical protein Q7T39_08650, partial [Polaromonas sp.]|nr:hypothetical protein [Polaromonas sp.]